MKRATTTIFSPGGVGGREEGGGRTSGRKNREKYLHTLVFLTLVPNDVVIGVHQACSRLPMVSAALFFLFPKLYFESRGMVDIAHSDQDISHEGLLHLGAIHCHTRDIPT